MKRLLWIAPCLLVLAGPAIAAVAANNTTVSSPPSLYPTLQCIGVQQTYVGDDNGNASAYVQWRRTGDTQWTRGVDLVRVSGARFAGSVFWLTAGTSYDVQVVVVDPDGGATSPTATVTTRPEPQVGTISQTWYVDPTGNDANSGSSGAPFKTIGKAFTVVQPGQEIRVRAGTYHEMVDTPRSGNSSQWIHLTGEPGAILDGSDPTLLHTTWTHEIGSVYSIPWTSTAGAARWVCADDQQRLFYQVTLDSLEAPHGWGCAQGFCSANGKLYVKLEDGSDPTGHTMHIGSLVGAILVDQSWWHISGMTIQHYGIGDKYQGWGIHLAGGGNNWIQGNTIQNVGYIPVWVGDPNTSDNLIENNTVRDYRQAVFSWDGTKTKANGDKYEEHAGISRWGGRGNVMRRNLVMGQFDGFDTHSGGGADDDWQENTVNTTGDDIIETDDGSEINLRFFGNTCMNSYNGFSVAGTASDGPEYVLYNVISNIRYKQMSKLSTPNGRALWFCQNTFVDSLPLQSTTNCGWWNGQGTCLATIWPVGPVTNVHYRNNIMVGTTTPAVYIENTEVGPNTDFDGDLYDVTGTNGLFVWNSVTYSTIPALRTGTGFEMHGLAADPQWSNPSGADYRLRAGSPCIDAGLLLPGINDLRYSGAGPDIGAFEYGSGTDTTPPRAITDLQ